MEILKNLNENQKNAVLQADGPLLILAGAGSGKTRVITHRIAYLIKENNISPYRIFAVTFTNKACEEMKKRIINMIGPQGNSIFIRTFHSASVYILRRYGDIIGIPNTFSIYDQKDQETVIKNILLDLRIDPKKYKPSMIAGRISEVKDRADLIEGSDLSLLLPDHFPFDFVELYKKYGEKLKELNALDFNDLLIKTVKLLRESQPALRELQSRWHYYMVDEYQDTNYAQYLITKYLSSESKNICVVGDDDQSIYSWRGADIRNILNFEKDYPDTKVITLQENYRSTEPILKAATSVIKNNINRKEKNLIAIKGDGELPIWCQTNNEYGEAEYVVNTIISYKLNHGYKNNDFSIFYRTNAQSRVFEDRLRIEGIPYKVVGGLKFYERKEVKDIIAYLRFIINPLDAVSMVRIINTPSRGIGKATLKKIEEASQIKQLPQWDIINREFLTGKIPKGISQFKKIINDARYAIQDIPKNLKLSKFVNDIIDSSGYRRNLKEENSIESTSRLENIDQLINSIEDYEIANPEATLDQFLQEISLYTAEENPEKNFEVRDNLVTLMTVHNAKGLEFPVVFLTGMEEKTFPHVFSMDSEDEIEEERRLCYVGITRAQEMLYITNAEMKRSFGGEVDYKSPSRFISEIPEDIIECKSYYSESYTPFRGNRKNFVREKVFDDNQDFDNIDQTIPDESSYAVDLSNNSASKFSVKERVIHPKYGQGRIVKIEGKGDNTKLTILFGTRKKTFLEKYTPLEKT
ncbi:ATP-dependent helicase [Spirochaetota bacterium]